MNRLILIVLISCFTVCAVYGQASISGSVLDTDSCAVAAAQISLEKAGKRVDYRLADEQGRYSFSSLSSGTYTIQVSSLGCKPQIKKAMIWINTRLTVDFVMTSSVLLNEVKIVSNGITMHGDTTLYALNHFVSGKEKSLKDVLEKLPNIQVDADSKAITVNGKRVCKILLEGQDLFQGNTSLPIDNLDGQDVKRVSVIDNYSEYNIYDGFRTSQETVINVDMKDEVKNRLSGNLKVNAGAINKYKVRNSSMYIGHKAMFSGILASNNIGNKLLTFQDLLQFSGGMNNLLTGDNPTERIKKMVQSYAAYTSNREDLKRNTNSLASLNYIVNPNSKLKLTVNGVYNYNDQMAISNHYYEYVSGLQYSDSSLMKGIQQNILLNAKALYKPYDNWQAIYHSKLMYSLKNDDYQHVINQGDIASLQDLRAMDLTNNLLLIRRLDKGNINLMIDYGMRTNSSPLMFEGENDFYTPTLLLDSAYHYSHKKKEHYLTTQLFYMYRLNRNYFLKTAIKSSMTKQNITSRLYQLRPTSLYDNDAHLTYNDYYIESLVGRDRGSLNFSLRLRYQWLFAKTNLSRKLSRKNNDVFSPMFQVKYAFSPYHHFTFNYEYSKQKQPLSSVLDNSVLTSYNQVIASGYNQLFYSSHKLSLLQVSMFPFIGLNMMNMVSYEKSHDDKTENYVQSGYTSITEHRLCLDIQRFAWMSTLEYRFVNLPVNIRANFSYNFSDRPMYSQNRLYETKSHNINWLLGVRSFYKMGVNYDFKWMFQKLSYVDSPMRNDLQVDDAVGLISWQNKNTYAAVNMKYSINHLNQRQMHTVRWGLEMRYQLNHSLELNLLGYDLLHLSERKQETGSAESHYAVNNTIWYTPGSLMLGLKYKY